MARALPPETLLALGAHESAPDVRAALQVAQGAPPDAAVFVTGSLYLVGEARAALVQ